MHLPFPRHIRTDHVRLEVRLCQSCGSCAAACTRGVLSVLPYAIHHHAHVDHADRCRGCLRCVRACSHGAIRVLQPRPPGRAGSQQASAGGEE